MENPEMVTGPEEDVDIPGTSKSMQVGSAGSRLHLQVEKHQEVSWHEAPGCHFKDYGL